MTLNGPISWGELLAEVEAQLAGPNEARWICELASGCDRNEFLLILNEHVSVTMARNVHEMLTRRLLGEPLQYVMRSWSFRHLDVMVDSRVLIPRPETEHVVDVALGLARQLQPRPSSPLIIVDLGTGSGVIGLSIASELGLGTAKIWLTDISEDALDVARANLSGIGRAAEHVRVLQGDWFEALPMSMRGAIDLIVCNPPYIAEGDPEVEAVVHGYEPHLALYSGPDGLNALTKVIVNASGWLTTGGWLVCEIGYRQGTQVRNQFVSAGFSEVEIINDVTGRPRVAFGRK